MRSTDFVRFEELAGAGRIVPVFKEFLADMETPVSVLKRFAGEENVFLLESVEGGERFGRYSFLGVRPRGIFTVEKGRAFFSRNGEKMELPHTDCPLDALRALVLNEPVACDPELPPLPGGAAGFLAYEASGMFEELPPPKADSGVPEAMFMLTDRVVAFDNIRHTVKIIVSVHLDEFPSLRAGYDCAVREIEELSGIIQAPCPQEERGCRGAVRFAPAVGREQFTSMVEKARRYIAEGEIIQAVLSQKFVADCDCGAFDIYRALRLVNPSPYTFFLKLGGRTLIGSSPETLVKLTGSRSCVRPIAGTRPRGADAAGDRALADELLKDEKERAEHLMLVDLGRNDLGRTARPGSVQLKSFMNVERYSHVMHLVSDVEGVLRDGCDAIDLIKSTFPAGTLSGAPKIRAMEIINELEDAPRGVYGGAVGYFSYDGNMDMAITIRTVELNGGHLTVQSGAGIVFDSDPDKEYEETLNKARALFKAVELAANGLDLERGEK